jgi:hypothetical protein
MERQPVEKGYQDLLVLSFIGAFVAGAFVLAIAIRVTSLKQAVEGATVAFLAVFLLLAILMALAIPTRKKGPELPMDETPNDERK